MHVLDADGARVRVAQHAEDVAQLHGVAAREPAGGELAVEVPDREAPVVRIELLVGARFLEAERIEVRDEVPAHAVHVDELLHGDDLVLRLDRAFERAVVGRPARRLVGDAEANRIARAMPETIKNRRARMEAL